MAKISLRAYNHEIENLVDQNQFDQAIAHARHILNIFPKHLQTYRLLGKAYLESQRFGDASDIFQRVLSSIPDDFVSHVGMSIVREDEGNLDLAIWHMERAFEVQPANVAIQGELRRLYGKRDGLEPPKVRLTRGALARMYLKGELYPQAITEIRTALAEDPDRLDLLVLLAQAYFLSNQRVEAANTCSTILQKLPNCFEATRLLAEILAKSERASEAEDYRKRLQLLEPYYAHLPPGATSAERAPESAIQVERLVWSPGKSLTGGPAQPEWAASLGVDIEATPEKETLPDWLVEHAGVEPEGEESVGEPAGAEVEEEGAPEEQLAEDVPFSAEEAIPEWMKAAGWEPAGEGEEVAATPEFEIEEELKEAEAAPADIPDWLKEIAPPEQPEEELPPGEEAQEIEALPEISWMEESIPEQEDVPDWLTQPSESEVSEVQMEETGATAEADLPADLTEADASISFAQPTGLEEEEPAAARMEADKEAESEPERVLLEDDEAFAWLENLAARQGATEAMLLEPEDRRETPPDWVLESSTEVAEPTELAELPIEDSAEPILSAEDETGGQPAETPGWLEELSAEQPTVQPEVTEFSAEDTAEAAELPDWLRELSAEETPEAADETFQSGLDEEVGAGTEPTELPDWLRELEPEAEAAQESLVEAEPTLEFAAPEETQETPESELPDWLKFSAEEGPGETSVTELPATPSPRSDESEWMPEALSQDVPGEQITPEAEVSAGELPDWLRSLSEEEVEGEVSPEITSFEAEAEAAPAELPEWLSELKEEPPLVPEQAQVPAVEFGMLFSPQELAKPAPIEAEKMQIEESPITVGDTQPTRVRHPEEEAEAPVPPVEATEEPVEEIPYSAIELEEEEIPSEDLIPDWLKGLGEEIPTEELVAVEAEAIESFPEPTSEELVEMEREEAETQLSEVSLEEEPFEAEMVAEQVDTFEPVEVEEQPLPTAEEEQVVPLDDESAFAWLESLAVKQGAEEALLLKPEERSEEPPDWVREALEEGSEAPPVEPEPLVEEMQEETVSAEGGQVEMEAAPPMETTEGEIIPDEIKAEVPPEEIFAEEAQETPPQFMEEVEAVTAEEEFAQAPQEEEAAMEAAPTQELEEAPEIAEPAPELPSWLVGVEDTRTAEEEAVWTPPVVGEVTPSEPEAPVTERLDLNRAGLTELERLPGVGFVRAQEILNYRQVNGPFFSVDELAEVPGMDADIVADIRDLVQVEFEEAEAPAAAAGPSEDKEIALIQARNSLIQGDTEAAIGYYEHLISTRQLLPDVIRDLNEALYRYPEDISFWQALGDAHVRAGNLQEALDAYSKAEELLR